MRLSRFQKLLSGLFFLAALVVFINAWLAFRAEEVLANSEYWVTHTLQVINNLESALRTSTEAESDARGYVLTDDPALLAAYGKATAHLPAQFNLLEHEVRDNLTQVRRIQHAAQMSARRMAILDQALSLHQAKRHAEQKALAARHPGVAFMLELRGTIQAAQQSERNLLTGRLNTTAKARTEARLAVGIASALDILFVVFALWSLTYERRLHLRAEEFSIRLEKLQSVTEVAFNRLTAEELTAELLARLRVAAGTDALVLCSWLGDEVELAAADGLAIQPGDRYKLKADGPLWQAVNQNQAIDLVESELDRLPIDILRAGHGSALVLPMTVASRTLAVLIATRDRNDPFTGADKELLSLAAGRIALALDRAAAYDAERDARRAAEAATAELQLLNDALEERVQQRTEELATTNRELEAFSYSVSHDLRAPLRSVDGFSVALEEDYGAVLQGDGKHYLSRIRFGVQRMGQLIDALLQLSRITRAELVAVPVDLSALALSVADDIEQRLLDRHLSFLIEPDLHTEGDPGLLRVVFENMFGNSAKFTGKVADPRIEFGWSSDQNAYYVRDNGAGFDQQYVGKLFVAFQRLHGDKDFQGSGIGLATVARVIHRHHGNIWAEGEVGRGATFWFTLK